ncbi:DUF1178 family protein, partial [Rhodopseudomonas sp. BAL398]|uniref:DUF1178 family protein n=1 Tax=Rhodopseudomonas sp. BAL398 TaxID=3034676 RepID=UPI0023E2CB5E
MIRYTLRCDRGHGFESWFQSSAACDSQVRRKLVNCPQCGSAKVEKAIMAPQIARKKGKAAAAAPAPPRGGAPPGVPRRLAPGRDLGRQREER